MNINENRQQAQSSDKHYSKETLCSHGHCNSAHNHHHHTHNGERHGSWLRNFIPEMCSLIFLIVALLVNWPTQTIKLTAYIIAVLPVALPILKSTISEWRHGDVFNEFTLMVLASVGAYLIEEYPEGVAVLLFYSVGEKLEDVVSGDVKGQIKNLLGKMPKEATVLQDDNRIIMKPEEVKPGMTILVKPGESVPLDGRLVSDNDIDFNTAAITGESVPRSFGNNCKIESGIIPVDQEAKIVVTNAWNDSSMNRIMQMIEDASKHRAPSETILRKITRWYTPVVFGAAILLFVIPWLISLINVGFDFEWQTWFRRSLVFLVCSCPCALIVSIPLTYFTSIGIASKKGILFKGHDSLDGLRSADTVVFDKTGTVTTGKFHIVSILTEQPYDESEILSMIASIEQQSKHPLAIAVMEEAVKRDVKPLPASSIITVNHGMKGVINGKSILIGSNKLMSDNKVKINDDTVSGTTIYIAVDGILAGIVSLADTVKEGVNDAVRSLHERGVKKVGILSGDSEDAVRSVAKQIGADFYRSSLMPADKQAIIRNDKESGDKVVFAGDGVNDAPALAAADIGIAMGSLGTDIAIESAQVVIAGDDLRKIPEGIDISRKVKRVIIENVTFAFGVKALVMILGAIGVASLWAAVFADTGVTLITILWTLYRLKVWQLKKNSINQ